MVKQKWLWGIVVLLLIVSIPGLVSRWDVESSSEQYEIIIPYEEMALIEENSNQTIDDILSTLKDAGLTTVNLSPISLKDLEKQSYIRIFNEKTLAERLLFTPYKDSSTLENKGYYITVPEAKEHRELIEESLSTEIVSFGESDYYFIPHTEILFPFDTKIGYDQLAIEKIREHGLMITLKIANSEEPTVNDQIVRQLVEMKEDDITGLIVYGKEMIGFDHDNKGDWYRPLHDVGYYFYHIEGHQVKGEHHFAKFAHYNVIRLISIDPIKRKLSVEETVDMATRAVKERNIRAVYYHIELSPDDRLSLTPFEKFGSTEENLDNAATFLTDVQEKMPDRFTLGAPKLFEKVNVPSWATALVLLAGILFTWIVSSLVKNKYVRLGSIAVMALLAVAYFVLNRVLFLQAFALIIAVITPIYAVVKSSNGSKRIGDILVQYVKALAISMIGIWIIVGLLNGNGFITGYEQFRGVKLVYIIPIVGVFLYSLSFFVQQKDSSSKDGLLSLLNKEVKYGHVLVLAILAAVAYFYISRTGNAGSVSTLELAFRQWLEDVLYVRPRTKEFLIGFPFFVLALYVMGINRKWGSILLIPGVIGLLSIVNTFTHLHIPLEVSLLRTLYGAVLGFVVGLVFIGLYHVIVRNVKKFVVKWK